MKSKQEKEKIKTSFFSVPAPCFFFQKI